MPNFYNTLSKLFDEKDPSWVGCLFSWESSHKGYDFWHKVNFSTWEEFEKTEAYDILLNCLQNRYVEISVDIKELL